MGVASLIGEYANLAWLSYKTPIDVIFVGTSAMAKVWHFPCFAGNPYHTEMFRGLNSAGIEPEAIRGGLKPLLKKALHGEGDILHLHWVHGPATSSTAFRAILRVVLFVFAILIWRLRGKKVVWTVHNLANHEKQRLWLDRWNSLVVAWLAHVVLVHGETARSIVARTFRLPEAKVRVVFHGNYATTVDAQYLDYRHEGIRFLFFGLIRSYKGIPDLVSAFQRLEGNHQLHIVGMIKDEALRREIETIASDDSRISLKFTYVSNDDLAELLAWCDVVVLPFREILTSGSLLMALTAGRPVVIPHAGVLTEYATNRCAFFYDPSSPDGLFGALRTATETEDIGKKAAAARERALDFDWTAIGVHLAHIYQGVTKG